MKETPFNEFCNIPSVKYWRRQLDGANVKNIENTSQLGGTRNVYTYGLLKFHNWLSGKNFQYTTATQIDQNLMQQCTKTIHLCGIDHLLALRANIYCRESEFTRLIKEYLADISNTGKNSIIKNSIYSIRSFFRENECNITFQFKHRIKRERKNQSIPLLSLEDLWGLLTINNIQSIEKAVFLCKFQRGLDSSTFADRFNFEVWECLVKHFGSEQPETWDLNNTPIPIPLVRVKTGFRHMGFLDIDAVLAIIAYLKIRQDKPKINNALFVDTKKNPITVNWISRRFRKLVLRSRLQDHPSKYKIENQCTSHEMRDLLKSTLIDSGCRPDIADHIIGHSPKDSYEKQTILYPKSIIHEFAKARKRINIFTDLKSDSDESYLPIRNNDGTTQDKSSNIVSIEQSIQTIQMRMDQHEKQILRMEKYVL